MTDQQADLGCADQAQCQELERILAEEGRELLQDRLVRGILIAIPLYLGFSVLDYYVVPGLFREFLLVRCAVVFLAVTVLTLHFASAAVRQRVRITSFLVPFVGGTGISMMTSMMGGFAAEYYLGVMLTIFMVGLYFPWGSKITAVFSVGLVTTYVLPNLLLTEAPPATALLPIFFLGGTAALTCWSAGGVEAARRKEISLRMQLEHANDELTALDEAKTKFFANVSHELRTPLMLILGPLESMREGKARDQDSLLRAMDANAHRLLRQVNMILNFSKLEAGQQEVSRDMGNVGTLLQSLVDGAAPFADGRGIGLHTEGLDSLPDIPFDHEKIETSAANLLSNAMKFTPDGGSITVRAGATGKGVWFEVEDTGCGIPSDQIEKIFERFHQVDGGKNGKVQGTGLGLALSRELVELHGGNVQVRSEVGNGTVFRVELPDADAIGWSQEPVAEPSLDATTDVGATRPAMPSAASTQFADVSGTRSQADDEAIDVDADAPLILLVEDNPDMRSFVAGELREHFRVRTAVDGVDGLETARRIRPDLIVSDVMMPRMDGFGLVDALRKDQAFARTPIIMLTARTGAESVVKGLSLGAVDYVAKPFRMPELLARISAQVRMRSVEATLDERDSRLVAVGQMTGSIAHDLRGPLTGIYNRIELLRMVADRAGNLPSIGEDLDSIEATVQRINGMIQELLDFVRGNRQSLDRRPVRVARWLAGIVQELQPNLLASGVELDTDLPDNADVQCILDPERMQRVVENLVNNAREAMVDAGIEAPRIAVGLRCLVDRVELTVEDNGPGIPEEIADTLFQPFATAGKSGGTGLGLAIVRNLVVAHGGEIDAERAADGGARFVIMLPRVRRIDATKAA